MTEPYNAKMEENLKEFCKLAGTDNAVKVLGQVLNQNTLSMLTKGFQTPDGDPVVLIQKKNDSNSGYKHVDSNGVEHDVSKLVQYAGANISVTTDKNGDFHISVDWPMYFNSLKTLNIDTGGDMRLTPHDPNRVQLSHLRGEFVVSKSDADKGVLNLTVGKPFTCEFDGSIS